jgi:hypothetical protein
MKTDIGRTSSIWLNPKGVSGTQSRRVQSWGRGKYGAANRGRRLTDQEQAETIKQMKDAGRLGPEVR